MSCSVTNATVLWTQAGQIKKVSPGAPPATSKTDPDRCCWGLQPDLTLDFRPSQRLAGWKPEEGADRVVGVAVTGRGAEAAAQRPQAGEHRSEDITVPSGKKKKKMRHPSSITMRGGLI